MPPLAKFYRGIEEMRKIDPEIQAHTINIFVMVCLRPGVTMKDLCHLLGVAQSTMSRNIAVLGKYHRFGHPGYDLVVAEEDPTERRRKIVNLTPKGRRVKESLEAALQGPGALGGT